MRHFTLFLSFFLQLGNAWGEMPTDILKKADEVRNPAESYLMVVEVHGKDQSENSKFEVSIKGNTKTVVRTLEPPRDRGRNLLMLGEEMWAYLPNLKRSVRISLNQKLSGQAANGDISRMRWHGDYSSVLESESLKSWTLLLTATKKGLTYDKIRAVIEKKTYKPIQAEFLTAAGKPLKKAYYENYQDFAGKLRPSQIRIEDSIRPEDRSVLTIRKMEVRNFPEALFNQNGLQ